MRVVSLVPSVTETLLAWGVEPVACTRFCEQPSLRHVGGTKDPRIDEIIALSPDLVIVDREENRREDAEALAAGGLTLHITHVTSVMEVTSTLDELSVAVGAGTSSDWSVLRTLDPAPPVRARAFVPIWRRPWMTINAETYGSSVLRACGVENVFSASTDRYPTVALEEVERCGPDMVLLPTEPYEFAERHVAEVSHVAPDVRIIDGKDLFWWGIRTVQAVGRLLASMS